MKASFIWRLREALHRLESRGWLPYRERCVACLRALHARDLVLPEESGGLIHSACCGPERECYVINGEPLPPGVPIPPGEPFEAWRETLLRDTLRRRVRQIVGDVLKALRAVP